METVSNAATTAATTATNAATTVLSTASKMVFGDTKADQSGTEPKSGETGGPDQPYDAGNVEPGNPGKNATEPEGATSATGDAATAPGTAFPPPSIAAHTDPKPPAASVDSPAAATEEKKDLTTPPAVEAVSNMTPAAQDEGAAKPTEVPSTEQSKAIDDKTKEAEAELKKDQPAVGGTDTKDIKPVEPVKSTGLAADGGDFDATKPGAASEADRLVKEKEAAGNVSASKAPEPNTPETKKKGTLTKLKEKLHIGSKKSKD